MELADRNLWDRFKECRAQGLPGIPRDELLGYMDETAEALDLMNNSTSCSTSTSSRRTSSSSTSTSRWPTSAWSKTSKAIQASVTGGVTPVYAAPETFDGWVSRFSDQYSLAICYQELLTGQRPFNGANVRQLIMQHLQAAPNVSPLPPADQPAIARALAKNPDDRHPTCLDMVQQLPGRPAFRQGAGTLRAFREPARPTAPPPPLDPVQTLEREVGPPSTFQDAATASIRRGPADSHPGLTLSIRAWKGPCSRSPSPRSARPRRRCAATAPCSPRWSSASAPWA